MSLIGWNSSRSTCAACSMVLALNGCPCRAASVRRARVGVRTVRAFAREDAEIRRYGAAVEESFEKARYRAWIGALFRGVGGLAGYGAIVVVLWYGGTLLVDGRMSMGELSSFLLYTLTVAVSLGSLATL